MKLTLAKLKSLLKEWTSHNLDYDADFCSAAGNFREATETMSDRLYTLARSTSMDAAIYHTVLATYFSTGKHAQLRAVFQIARQFAGFKGTNQKAMTEIYDQCREAWKLAMSKLKAIGITVLTEDVGGKDTWSRIRTKDFSLEGKNKGNTSGRTPTENAYFLLDNLFKIEGMTIAKARKAFDKACERHAK